MFTKYKSKKGFTLIELLVVISIIGLLSTLAIVALNNARMRSRDAKRVADMKQLQTAMQLFFDANRTFNPSGCTVSVPAAISTCTDGNPTGLLSVFPNVASFNDPTTTATTPCDHTAAAAGGDTCNYAFSVTPTGTTYTVAFHLEAGSGDLDAGDHILTDEGMK